MIYRFGVFEFDASSGVLLKNGRTTPLEPQPARALALLLARADQVVSKADLRSAIWGADTHVDFDRGLAYCLSQMRAALGDSSENPRFIQTLPRRGYRFVAPVHSPADVPVLPRSPRDAQPENRARRVVGGRIALGLAIAVVIAGLSWTAWSRVAPFGRSPRHVIAVSVFDNETGNADYDRLVAGLSDLVVTRLTEIDPTRIGVVGNSAVLRRPRNIRNLQAIAAGVRADFAVLGQLQRGNGGLRFITHFIRLSDETHLRANRIELPDGDVSGLEAAVVAEFERATRAYALN